MKTQKLHEIADVIAGYSFRKGVRHSENGSVLLIQSGDVNSQDVFFNVDDLQSIEDAPSNSEAYVQKGDVLLIAKSSGQFKNSICYFGGSSDETLEKSNVLASSSLIIIRPKLQEINSEYVSSYLNSKEGQEKIRKLLLGTSTGIQGLSLSLVRELEIPIPTQVHLETFRLVRENMELQKKYLQRKIQILSDIERDTLRTILGNETR